MAVNADSEWEEVVSLTSKLVKISSCNPGLAVHGEGQGEEAVATFVASWLKERGFEVRTIGKEHGRPSVLAIGRGHGGKLAKTLMFNGHLDTVGVQNYNGNPYSGHVRDGRLYGRGAADMKGGLAAAMIASAAALRYGALKGDVVIAAVADEEMTSKGSMDVLAEKIKIDAAIFPEPTQHDVVTCHRGFVWIEVKAHGKASHGSKYAEGRDAIGMMGLLLYKVHNMSASLLMRAPHPELGVGSMHCGTIQGGVETSTYPSQCTLTIERRTLPGEDAKSVKKEIDELIEQCMQEDKSSHLSSSVLFERPPLEIYDDRKKFAHLVEQTGQEYVGQQVEQAAGTFWTDAALFNCPAVVFGPRGHGIHEEEEYVETSSLIALSKAYYAICKEFCS